MYRSAKIVSVKVVLQAQAKVISRLFRPTKLNWKLLAGVFRCIEITSRGKATVNTLTRSEPNDLPARSV
jgi:hypothetical protein